MAKGLLNFIPSLNLNKDTLQALINAKVARVPETSMDVQTAITNLSHISADVLNQAAKVASNVSATLAPNGHVQVSTAGVTISGLPQHGSPVSIVTTDGQEYALHHASPLARDFANITTAMLKKGGLNLSENLDQLEASKYLAGRAVSHHNGRS